MRDLLLIVVLPVALGLLAWAIAKTVLDVKHWYENELDKWNDFLRGWRQFFEQLQPLLIGLSTALVFGLLTVFVYLK